MDKNKLKIIILISIFVLACVLRLAYLDSRSLWGDEVDSVFVAFDFASHDYTFQRASLLKCLTFPVISSFQDGSKMPLYFILLGVWINIFGPASIGLRLLSVIFGILSIMAFYFFMSKYFKSNIAMLGTFLLAVSPMHILYSNDIRVYSLMVLLAVLSLWYLMKILNGEKNAINYAWYITWSTLFVYVHYFSVLFLFAQIAVVAIASLKERSAKKYQGILFSQSLVFLMFALWAVSGLLRFSRVLMGGEALIPQATYNFILRTASVVFALFFGESIAPWNPFVAVGMLALIALFIRYMYSIKDMDNNVTVFSILFVVSIISSMVLKNVLPNYLIPVLPVLMALIAYSIFLFRSFAVKLVLVILICVVCAVSILNYYSLREIHNSNRIEPWKRIAGDLSQEMVRGDRIYVNDWFVVFRELNYYLNVLSNKGQKVRLMDEGLSGDRIFLVLHIHDEDQKDRIFSTIRNAGYGIRLKSSYVPYSETIASKLPRKHHKIDQSRVEVYVCTK